MNRDPPATAPAGRGRFGDRHTGGGFGGADRSRPSALRRRSGAAWAGRVRRTRRRVRRTPGRLAGHPVAWTASRMTRVTTEGLEMRDRCPALTSVMWAPARWAMNVWLA